MASFFECLLNNYNRSTHLKNRGIYISFKTDRAVINELIAEIFYLRKFIETWGTGIQTMMNSCKTEGVPMPQFSELTHGIMITFKFIEPIGATVNLGKKFESTIRQNEILKLLAKKPLNATKISELLSDDLSVRLIQKDLVKLEKAGLIHRSGKARGVIFAILK